METGKMMLIANAVCIVTGYSIHDLRIERGCRALVDAKRIFVHLCKAAGYSYPEIAKVLNRNHVTMMHHNKMHDALCETDRGYRDLADKAEELTNLYLTITFAEFARRVVEVIKESR